MEKLSKAKKSIIWITSIFGFLAVMANGAIIHYIFHNHDMFSGETAVNSIIISNGLSVISLAVSVWLGMNIYNVVEKQEVNQIEKRILDLQKEMQEVEKISELIKENSKHQLFNEMYKLDEPSSNFFAKQFEKDSSLTVGRYLDLLTIEILLQRIYGVHHGIRSEGENIIKWAVTGIEKINIYRKNYNERSSLENLFVDYREGDFWFYMGYYQDRRNGLASFAQAKRLFSKIVDELGLYSPLTPLTLKKTDSNYIPDPLKKRMTIYFANAIGQCSKKMADALGETEEEYDNLMKDAKKCIKYAAEECEFGNEREVYYRNYGCIIENLAENFEDLQKAGEQMRKAFELDPTKEKVFHTIVSNYNKRIQNILGIEMRVPKKERKEALLDKSYDGLDKKGATELIGDFRVFISVAISLFPSDPKWYAFSIYRKIYEMCIEVPKRTKIQLKKMEEDVKCIKILNGKSPLCRVAIDEVNDIREKIHKL